MAYPQFIYKVDEDIQIICTVKPIKTLRLSIKRDGTPCLSIPAGISKQTIANFICKHTDWLREHMQQQREKNEKRQNQLAHTFTEGDVFTYLGNDYVLHFTDDANADKVVLQDDKMWLRIDKGDSSPKTIMKAINNWYFEEMRSIIDNFLAHWLPIMHQPPLTQVRFKTMKSRWGSMMPQQRIVCFNMRLIFYPLPAIEEVVVHELCHLFEPSHNQRFHALMKHYLPDYKQRDMLLKQK